MSRRPIASGRRRAPDLTQRAKNASRNAVTARPRSSATKRRSLSATCSRSRSTPTIAAQVGVKMSVAWPMASRSSVTARAARRLRSVLNLEKAISIGLGSGL